MGLRKLKPTTPGQRFKVVNDFEQLTTGNNPVKSLVLKKSKSGGRNNTGKMTMRHTGGGHKKRYRVIDFKRNKFGIPATVSTVEYDPNRTAFIALLSDSFKLIIGNFFPVIIISFTNNKFFPIEPPLW